MKKISAAGVVKHLRQLFSNPNNIPKKINSDRGVGELVFFFCSIHHAGRAASLWRYHIMVKPNYCGYKYRLCKWTSKLWITTLKIIFLSEFTAKVVKTFMTEMKILHTFSFSLQKAAFGKGGGGKRIKVLG